MIHSKQSKVLLVVGASVVLTTVVTLSARNLMAQPASQQLTITEVTVDAPTPGLLTIEGRNLDNGSNLAVTLGDSPVPLSILTAGSTQVVATLPDPMTPGDYLLIASTGMGASRRDVYDLTVGAVGPQGPPGPPGAVPEGSIILWDRSNQCPQGFVRVTDYDGRFLVSGAAPGVVGGSNTHSHGAGTFTAPSHRHSLEPWDHTVGPVDDNSGGTDFNSRTGPAGEGVMSGASGESDSRPEFTTILLCRRT